MFTESVIIHAKMIVVIIKGIKEHNDPSKFFRSSLGIKDYLNLIERLQIITVNNQLTEKGEQIYNKIPHEKCEGLNFYTWKITEKEYIKIIKSIFK